MVAAVTWDQALAWRMRRQYLLEKAPAGQVVRVAARLGGLHAQVMSAARLALWARVDDLGAEDLSAALWQERSLVKFWAMRGTLHLLDARDWATWVAALATYEQAYSHYGMRDPELALLAETLGELLDGRVLTRNEIIEQLEAGGHTSGERATLLRSGWGSALKPASVRGTLCFGPDKGRLVRFTHPRAWLREELTAPGTADNANVRVVRRYLGAYAPAATADFAAWWGVSVALADSMLREAGDELDQVRIDGAGYWVLADSVDQFRDADPLPPDGVVRLLPAFDPWVVAGNRRGRPGVGNPTLEEKFRSRVYRTQGWVSPVVTLDGRIEGTWSHRVRGGRLEVEIQPFNPLRESSRSALEAEAGRLQDFLGCSSSSVSEAP